MPDDVATTTAATTTAATTTAATTAAATTTQTADTTATTAATTTTEVAKTVFADDWRQSLAGDDADALKLLARHNDPQSVLRKLMNQEKLITSGQYKKGLGDAPTPEEIATYRKANGIPETPEAYDLSGIKYDEGDKAAVQDFLKTAHDAHMAPAHVQATLKWLTGVQAQAAEETEKHVNAVRQQTVETLRAKWGSEYQANTQAMTNLLAGAPKEVQELFKTATDADGVPIGALAPVMEWVASMAREINPLPTLIESGGLPAMNNRKAELKKLMGTPNSDYWKGPKSAQLQKEYQDILKVEQRMQK